MERCVPKCAWARALCPSKWPTVSVFAGTSFVGRSQVARVMAELPDQMQPEPIIVGPHQPQTRTELQAWVRDHLHLTSALEAELLQAIDAVFSRHERMWRATEQGTRPPI